MLNSPLLCVHAASDAYCLLEVYAKLQEDPARFGWNPGSTGIPPGKASASSKAKRTPIQQAALPTPTEVGEPRPEVVPLPPVFGGSCFIQHPLQDPSPGPEGIPGSPAAISVRDFHVVCDNMLKGLGRYLRCLGVDVRILENDDEHRKAAEVGLLPARTGVVGRGEAWVLVEAGMRWSWETPCVAQQPDLADKKHWWIVPWASTRRFFSPPLISSPPSS